MPIDAAVLRAADAIARGLPRPLQPQALAAPGAEIVLTGLVGLDFGATDVLAGLQRADGADVTIRVNSPGGLVFEGFHIFNALARYAGRRTVVIEGVAASAASWIPMAADEVVMPRASMLMIHQASGLTIGTADDHASTMAALRGMDSLQVSLFAERTGIAEAELRAMLVAETWMTAEEAVDRRFADRIEQRQAATARAPLESAARALAGRGVVHIASATALAQAARRNATTSPAQEPAMPEPTPAPTPAPAPAPAPSPAQNPAPAPAPGPAADPAPAPALVPPAPAGSPVIHPPEPLATIEQLQGLAARASLGSDFVLGQLVARATMTAAQDAALGAMAASRAPRPPALTGGMVDLGAEAFRKGAYEALLVRAGKGKPTAEARPYMAMTLLELSRQAVATAGGAVGNMDRDAIAGAALGMRRFQAAAGMHTTGDLPSILANVARKVLLDAYQAAESQWRPLARVVSHSDFKPVAYPRLSEAPELLQTGEHQPYTFGKLSDKAETLAVAKFGRMIGLTREAIINDDLGALTRLPAMFGQAASDAISKAFWAILTANVVMGDGVALFHATHGNLAGSGSAITKASISAARAAMRKQTGLQKRPIVVTPKYLVVSPDKETEAQTFLATQLAVTTGEANVFYRSLELIVVPWLQGNTWFLFANPAQIDTIYVAFLNGNETPDVAEEESIEVDGLTLRARIEFGVGAIDWRGIYQDPGAAS